MQRAGERADGRRERRAAVGAGRGDDARGEGRRVQAVLGGADPVRVDRLDVPSGRPRRASAAGTSRPPSCPARRRRRAPRRSCRRRRAPSGRRSPSSAPRAGRGPRAPARRRSRSACRAATSPASRAVSAWRSAGALPVRPTGSYGSGSGIADVEVVVDEQAPDVLVRVVADELLDVDRRGSGATPPSRSGSAISVSTATTPSRPGLKSFIAAGNATRTAATLRAPVESRAGWPHRVDPHPRRRHRPRADRGDAPRARGDRRRVRLGRPRGGRGGHGRARRQPAARPRRSTRSATSGRRAQGPDHDAGRRRLPLGQRRPAQGARHVRAGAAVQELPGRALALRRRRPRSSCARTPRTSTRGSSTSRARRTRRS